MLQWYRDTGYHDQLEYLLSCGVINLGLWWEGTVGLQFEHRHPSIALQGQLTKVEDEEEGTSIMTAQYITITNN